MSSSNLQVSLNLTDIIVPSNNNFHVLFYPRRARYHCKTSKFWPWTHLLCRIISLTFVLICISFLTLLGLLLWARYIDINASLSSCSYTAATLPNAQKLLAKSNLLVFLDFVPAKCVLICVTNFYLGLIQLIVLSLSLWVTVHCRSLRLIRLDGLLELLSSVRRVVPSDLCIAGWSMPWIRTGC